MLDFVTLGYGTDSTFPTGIHADTITAQYDIPGGGIGGLLYNSLTGVWTPFPVATPSGVNFPGAIESTAYGPSFGSKGGILRVAGSYETTTSSPNDIGYLYDGAAAPASRLTTLFFPDAQDQPGDSTLFTIAHSTFGNQVVGDYDTRLSTGNAFIYDIPTGTYVTNNVPGALSTTAYGVWGDHIAVGYSVVGPGGGAGVNRG